MKLNDLSAIFWPLLKTADWKALFILLLTTHFEQKKLFFTPKWSPKFLEKSVLWVFLKLAESAFVILVNDQSDHL